MINPRAAALQTHSYTTVTHGKQIICSKWSLPLGPLRLQYQKQTKKKLTHPITTLLTHNKGHPEEERDVNSSTMHVFKCTHKKTQDQFEAVQSELFLEPEN